MLDPDRKGRVLYCVPPLQVREHVPHALQGPNTHSPGQGFVAPVHACSWMKVVVEQAGDVCCREGGMVYRTRVWVPGPQLVLQTDQVLLPARTQKKERRH